MSSAIDHASSRTLLVVLLADVLLVVLTVLKGYPAIWSDFDKEANLWTLGSSIQAVLVAVVAYINYLLVSCRQQRARTAVVISWAFLAAAFVFFALDDMLLLHERGGHAVEDALPFLSRSQIVVYMDDLIELSYVVCGLLFGVFFLRKQMWGCNAFRYYVYGLIAVFAATCIGLHPAVKSIPFPLAVIQMLQLLSLYMFFVSFTNYAAAEVSLIVDSLPGGRSDGEAIRLLR